MLTPAGGAAGRAGRGVRRGRAAGGRAARQPRARLPPAAAARPARGARPGRRECRLEPRVALATCSHFYLFQISLKTTFPVISNILSS